ncbi:hypothetical protein [Microbacterium sp. YY-01]|uniref:hypothetical protein n=1 Tax=Microbacterium sp. YY-01 TaxID=3421634 RepID=UPI003D167C5C
MPNSPRGHYIDNLDGTPSEVIARGEQIIDLATKMSSSSELLANLVSNGAEMEGEAIDKLREHARDVHAELGRAADLYHAVGPHMLAYGEQLETSQPLIDGLVESLRNLWRLYCEAQQVADAYGYSTPNYPTGEDANDPDLRKQAEDDLANRREDAENDALRARQAWDTEAAEYDSAWDTWYGAFNDAAQGIREETSDAIRDSTSDNIRGFLETFASFLAVAGIILAVLALVIGGPIIAALGTIVAVLSLLTTIAQMYYGDADGGDLAWAIVGVIPFSKIFSGASGVGKGMTFADDWARWTGKGAGSVGEWAGGLNAFKGMSFAEGLAEFSADLFTGRGASDWARVGSNGRHGWAAIDTLVTIWGGQGQLIGDLVDWGSGNKGRAIGDFFDWNHRLFS